jgi:hypothetical protein
MTTATPTNPFPQVPYPGGAVKADPWEDLSSSPFRYFEGSRWVVDRREDLPSSRDIDVYIAGIQAPDGTIEREVVVNQCHADDPMTPRQARQLARALIAAVAEVDGWAARDE